MSHNFRISTTSKNDIIKNYTKSFKKNILNSEDKTTQRDNNLRKNRTIQKSKKTSIFIENQKDLIDLEESYKNCMIYLETIKKHIQKNIVNNNYDLNDNIVKKNF